MEKCSRRQCLRIEGIVKPQKEKTEDVTNIVKECFPEADIDIPDTVLDRAHRIGPVYKDESDQNLEGIIVKFSNFRHRSMFRKNRKKLKRGKRVRIDLTSNRYNLLKKTNALIKGMKMNTHCVKSVQIQSYFWSVFSCIRIECGDLLCKSSRGDCL